MNTKVLSNENINDNGYYPLNDCALLSFVGMCPYNTYNLESCDDCPFQQQKGNDYFQMNEFYAMPIKTAVEIIMSRHLDQSIHNENNI